VPELFLRAREQDPRVEVTPVTAGWRWLSFSARRVAPGQPLAANTGPDEVCLVLIGGACEVEASGRRYALAGRDDPFGGMPVALYLPPGTEYSVRAEAPTELGVAASRAEGDFEPRLIEPADVDVETRGSGNATRQINHILPPEFPAHRLLVVEVLTPAGNWSSYPPHKHERVDLPAENDLEEVYHYRVSRPEGFGVQRLYTRDGTLDHTWTVRDADTVLVPRGYHPFAAAHGYDCYYLNALAGPERSMAASDDPDLAWVRETWPALERDPRVPLVGAGA
jgi:5-deoxy-glucuronate isomerase